MRLMYKVADDKRDDVIIMDEPKSTKVTRAKWLVDNTLDLT